MNNVYYRELSDEEIIEQGDLVIKDDWDPNHNISGYHRNDFLDKHNRLPQMEPAHAWVGARAGIIPSHIWRIEFGTLAATSEPVSNERNIDINL